MTLLLTVPQQAPISKAARMHLINNKRWLADLCWEDTGVCLQQILIRLKEQNRCSMKPPKRWSLLEEFQHPLQQLEETIDRNLINCRLPLPPALADEARIAAEIEMEMAYGYKIILLQQAHAFHATPPNAQVTQRTLFHLYLTYCRSSLQYQPIPEGLWFEIHQLFHSCTKNLRHRTLTHPRAPEKICSIAGAYLQAILIGVFNPHQQLISTTLAACTFLGEYSGAAKLSIYRKPDSSRGKFIIEPVLDLPAKPLALIDQNSALSATWLLDTKPLTMRLRKLWRERNTRKYTPIVADKFFISRALRAWDLVPNRISARLSKKSGCTVVFSLPACHQLLHNKSLLIPDHLLQYTTSPTRKIVDRRYRFIQQLLANHESATQHPIVDWYSINESPTGLCLCGTTSNQLTLDLGSVLAMDIDHEAWHIGIVRWVRQHPQALLQLGVENLGPGITPVATMLDTSHRVTDIVSALLIPQNPLLERPVSLLIDPGRYSKGQSLLLDDGHTLYRFSCVKLLEQHHYFDLLALQATT